MDLRTKTEILRQMVQWLGTLLALPEDWSWFPAHMSDGSQTTCNFNSRSSALFWSPLEPAYMWHIKHKILKIFGVTLTHKHSYTHVHTHTLHNLDRCVSNSVYAPVTLTLLVFLKYLFTHSFVYNTYLSINLWFCLLNTVYLSFRS